MKKIIVCWGKAGHDIIDDINDLPENADLLGTWAEYTLGEPCPLCGATPGEIQRSLEQ